MALLAQTCPHCSVEKVQFSSKAQTLYGDRWTVFFVCNSCGRGVIAEVKTGASRSSPHDYPTDLRGNPSGYAISQVYPSPQKSAAPDHTPENVANFYVQALDALKRGHFDAAGAMFRKALDVATKKLDGSLKGDLYKRIESLAASHKITGDMKEWAHAVRLDGNDAVHDEEPFGKEAADQLASFVEVFLMYAFMMPGLLEARKASSAPATK